MSKLIGVIFLFLCFYSCRISTRDYGGYILSENPEYGENLTLSYSDTSAYHQWEDGTRSLQKGVFLKYISNNIIDTLFIWEGATVIEAYINDINCDSFFVIVDQKPLDSIWGPMVNVNSAPIREKQFENARDAEYCLENSKIHSFWIIDKKKKEVYGPMQKHEYDKKRKELNVSQDLVLKED